MGEKVGRIEQEYVLGVICDQNMPIDIHGREHQVEGIAVESEDDELYVKCETEEGKFFKRGEMVRVYFSYFGHTMMFETKISQPGATLALQVPPGLVKNLERKFERIPSPEGLSMSFEYEDVTVELSFPQSREYREVDEPLISEYFDTEEIQSLISQFREKAKGFAEHNNIVMFRNREPSSFEERLIVDTGKTIFIPQLDRGLPWEGQIVQHPIITQELFPEPTEQEGSYLGMNRQQVKTYFVEKSASGTFSEIYAPIIYLNYVVGYIHLYNTHKRKRPFNLDTLDFAMEFSYVLAYSLKENGYFQSDKKERKHFKAEIINISASGILFSYPSGELARAIRIYTDLDLLLHLDKRSIKVSGRVMRRYEVDGMTYFGVQFMEIQPEDFRFLFDHVYGRPFTEKDDQLWEGGATPPKVEL